MADKKKEAGKATMKCMSCNVTVLKDSNTEFCEFCGNNVCKTECLTKMRPFPNGKEEGGRRIRGKICKLCDRKFLVRQVMTENLLKIEEKDRKIAKLN